MLRQIRALRLRYLKLNHQERVKKVELLFRVVAELRDIHVYSKEYDIQDKAEQIQYFILMERNFHGLVKLQSDNEVNHV